MNGATDHHALRDRYLAAQLLGNRREALRVIIEDGLDRGLDAAAVHAVIRDAQQEIGDLWQADRISIAQEHMATAISQVVLSHLYQYAQPAQPNGKKILVACVEGEHHDLPARLVADTLDLAGFEVRYLGPNVPTDHLLRMVEQERPDLLVLSVTMTFNVAALRQALGRLRTDSQRPVPIAIGGSACIWDGALATELKADITGADAGELVTRAKALLEVV